jgi:hypothetical protein
MKMKLHVLLLGLIFGGLALSVMAESDESVKSGSGQRFDLNAASEKMGKNPSSVFVDKSDAPRLAVHLNKAAAPMSQAVKEAEVPQRQMSPLERQARHDRIIAKALGTTETSIMIGFVPAFAITAIFSGQIGGIIVGILIGGCYLLAGQLARAYEDEAKIEEKLAHPNGTGSSD